MLNLRPLLPETQVIAREGAGLAQNVATTADRGGLDRRNANHTIGRGQAWGKQRGRRVWRGGGGGQSRVGGGRIADESVALVESPL